MITDDVFDIKKTSEFNELALRAFDEHVKYNKLYGKWAGLFGRTKVKSVEEIPFLPVSFFKSEKVQLLSEQNCQKVFTSSSTGGGVPSKHHVHDLSVYSEAFTRGFELNYGKIEDYLVLCLLPSYLEREGSSLVYMAEDFIKRSKYKESGFFLYNHLELKNILEKYNSSDTKVLLLGVSFALLDFVADYKMKLSDNVIVMETGGMKGRRDEISREEMHCILSDGFGLEQIHSEYGMCELLSQSYSKGAGIFTQQPWMKMFIADSYDPLTILKATPQKPARGVLHIIDLANWFSCPFIATEDLAELYYDGTFKLIGRVNRAEIRGCNLLVQ